MATNREAQVKKAVDEAAAMVKGLPEAIQAMAFSKAFDALLGGNGVEKSGAGGSVEVSLQTGSSRRSARARGPRRGVGKEPVNEAATLIRELNRTEHPQIRDGCKALDLALQLLRAARDKCGIEWLTPSAIAEVLREKFMVKVDAAAVRMALGNSDCVDRRPKGLAYEYRLMAPGEKYLEELKTPAQDKK